MQVGLAVDGLLMLKSRGLPRGVGCCRFITMLGVITGTSFLSECLLRGIPSM